MEDDSGEDGGEVKESLYTKLKSLFLYCLWVIVQHEALTTFLQQATASYKCQPCFERHVCTLCVWPETQQ